MRRCVRSQEETVAGRTALLAGSAPCLTRGASLLRCGSRELGSSPNSFPRVRQGLGHDRELASTTLLPDHVALAASLIVGDSPAICAAKEIALRLAPTTVPLLVTGETGTGKELFAQLIHRASQVSSGPFVSVNCAAVPEPLLHAELFGYEPGAFTGAAPRGRQGRMEAARDGTLFLDEIGDLSGAGQAALLRFLDTGEIQKIGRSRPTRVRARIVCATHRDLAVDATEAASAAISSIALLS